MNNDKKIVTVDVIRSSEDVYTPVAGPAIGRIEDVLIKNNIPYELLSPMDTPDEVPDYAIFNGHKFRMGVSVFKTTIESESIINIISAWHNKKPDEELEFRIVDLS